MKDPAVGDKIDNRYLLKREIARGGMGIVFEAEHRYTGRLVALKVLTGEVGLSTEAQNRLLLEARALTTVRHPNVVEVLDAGMSEGSQPYVALEMLEGRTLDGILAARPRLSVDDTVQVGRQMCQALEFMHARGVVHRDVKPSNIFVTRNEIGEEIIKLFDLGIAALAPSVKRTNQRLTLAGSLMGTPEYMAPEQLLAKDAIDGRSDVYATGITLFECLLGDVPFTGSYPEILMKVTAASVPPSLNGPRQDVSVDLSNVITKAISREPEDRFQDAQSFALALMSSSGLPVGRSTLLGSFLARPGVPAVGPGQLAAVAQRAGYARANTEAQPRRRFPRAPYMTPARIVASDNTSLDGRTEDISAGGLLVVSDRPCRDNDTVKVRFALPFSGAMVTLAATARWVRAARRGRGAIGLEFIELPADALAAIEAYVAFMRPVNE